MHFQNLELGLPQPENILRNLITWVVNNRVHMLFDLLDSLTYTCVLAPVTKHRFETMYHVFQTLQLKFVREEASAVGVLWSEITEFIFITIQGGGVTFKKMITCRCGHRLIPSSRQRFFNAVTPTPSCRAAPSIVSLVYR